MFFSCLIHKKVTHYKRFDGNYKHDKEAVGQPYEQRWRAISIFYIFNETVFVLPELKYQAEKE